MTKKDIPKVQIHHEILRKIISRYDTETGREIFDNLVLKKYVDIDEVTYKGQICHFYVPHKKCKTYSLKSNSTDEVTYTLEVKACITILKKVYQKSINNKLLSDTQNQNRLNVANNTLKLSLNDNAIADLEERMIDQKRNANDYFVDFNNNHQSSVVDTFGFRLHTKASNTYGKTLSQFAEYKSIDTTEKCIGIDIKNSQPFWASVINSELLKRLKSDNNGFEYITPIIPILEKYENNEDYILYKNHCKDGVLYENLIEHYNCLFNIKRTRDEIKTIVFKALYSNYKTHSKSTKEEDKRAISTFKSLFPSVYNCFGEIQSVCLYQKVLVNSKTGGYYNFKNLALINQRLESCFIYDYLSVNLKHLWHVTVHDSIIIREKDYAKALDIFKNTFDLLSIDRAKLSVK